jgi:outer membrane protein TolC
LPILSANRRAIEVARAERDVARTGAEAAVEGLSNSVAKVRLGLATARARAEVLTERLRPLLELQASETSRLIELGALDVLVLVDGARREFAAELLALDIEAELARSGVELNALLGPGPAPAEAPEHSLPGDEPKR